MKIGQLAELLRKYADGYERLSCDKQAVHLKHLASVLEKLKASDSVTKALKKTK